jgi:hypothetical protein
MWGPRTPLLAHTRCTAPQPFKACTCTHTRMAMPAPYCNPRLAEHGSCYRPHQRHRLSLAVTHQGEGLTRVTTRFSSHTLAARDAELPRTLARLPSPLAAARDGSAPLARLSRESRPPLLASSAPPAGEPSQRCLIGKTRVDSMLHTVRRKYDDGIIAPCLWHCLPT